MGFIPSARTDLVEKAHLCRWTNACFFRWTRGESFSVARLTFRPCEKLGSLGQGRLFLPPAVIHSRPVRLPFFFNSTKTKEQVAPALLFWLWATKKIFSPSLRMTLNSHINHGESRVYHQFRRNCISSKRSFVYHHCEKECSLRLMIYTFGDEMHACA